MARCLLRHICRDRAGNVLEKTLVNVFEKGTSTAVSDMFAAESGGAAITTLESNSQGEVVGWFTEPKFVDLVMTDNNNTAFYPSLPSQAKTFTDVRETVQVVPIPETIDADVTAAVDAHETADHTTAALAALLSGTFASVADTITAAAGRAIAETVVSDTIPFDTTSHDGFGVLLQTLTGKLMSFYAKQTSDGNGPADVMLTESTDGGASWSTPVVVFADGGTGLSHNGAAGGVTPTGRIVIGYIDRNQDTDVTNAFKTRYSDDEGATWSNEFTLVASGFNGGSWYGKLLHLEDGRLLMPAWFTDGTTYSSKVAFSDDDGATWGNLVTVLANSTTLPNESMFVHLGAGDLIGMIRLAAGTMFRQVKSTDNGATWTDQGTPTFTSGLSGSEMTADMSLIRENGRSHVVLYHRSTPTGALKAILGDPTELLAGVSGWDRFSYAAVSSVATRGYPTFVHPDNKPLGIGFAMKQTSSTDTDLVLLKWDASKRADIWVPAQAMYAAVATPGAVSSRTFAYLLDPTTDEQLWFTTQIPPEWKRMHVEVWWANAGAGTGTVRFMLLDARRVSGSSGSAGETTREVTSGAALALDVWNSTFLQTYTIPADRTVWAFRLIRDADHANDTLANDIAVLGVRLYRAS